MTDSAPDASSGETPTAELLPERRVTLMWIVPVLALLLVAWLGYKAWVMRGTSVIVQLDRGHGLRVGDEVRYRGMSVGEIRSVDLEPGLDGVIVTASLSDQAEQIARHGARFWIVRPSLRLSGLEGLETIMGPRYLAVLPGDGVSQRRFVGLHEPPVVTSFDPGDLEVIVETPRRGSLAAGVPVLYRQVRVGTVLSVGIGSDGGSVEARVHVEQPYAQLIRRDTVFWDAGGLSAQVGLTGARLEVDSLQSALTGALAVATPPEGGDVVHTGHRFAMQEEPEDALEWEPLVVIGSDLLPPGAGLPTPRRARLAWKQGVFKGKRSRQGWVLQTEAGLLGPADLLRPAEKAAKDTVSLEVAGRMVPLDRTPLWDVAHLALLEIEIAQPVWPLDRCRTPDGPEDCIAVGDPTGSPFPLAAARLTESDRAWIVDPAVSVDETWHGASVLSRGTGDLVGMLVVEGGEVRVALLPEVAVKRE